MKTIDFVKIGINMIAQVNCMSNLNCTPIFSTIRYTYI